MGGRFRLKDAAGAGAALLLLAGSLTLWAFVSLRPDAPPTGTRTTPAAPPSTGAGDRDGSKNGADDLERAFSDDVRSAARCATVHVVNDATGADGSGVLLAQDATFAYVLTANHVTADGARFELSTFSAVSYPRPANVYRSAMVLAHSPLADLAVLRFATDVPLPGKARPCPPADVPQGAFAALTVGCDAGGAPISVVEKVLSRSRVRKPGADEAALYWEVAGKPEKGRSGGPLLDRKGRLLGVASGVGDGKGYYAHANEIRSFLSANGLKWLYEEE